MAANKLDKSILAIIVLAMLLGIDSVHAETITLDFESETLGGTTPPTGWSMVTIDASPAYVVTPGASGTGLGGQVTANHDSNSPTVPGGYVVNSGGTALLTTQPISGSFNFSIPEAGNYSGALFMLGDIQTGIAENDAGEYLAMHLRRQTFGARAQIVDGAGASLATDNNNRISSDTWYTADFTWTPTSGTTGDFSYSVDYPTPWTETYSGYTFNSDEAHFGFGSGGYYSNDHSGVFDNISITGTGAVVLPPPPPPGPGTLLIDDHFDNSDLATDVNGINGGFVLRSNSGGGSGSASEAGTHATMVTTGNSDNTGIVSINSFDAASLGSSGFEMSFDIDGVSSDPQTNGMFLGMQDQNAGFFRDNDNFGLAFSGNEGRTASGGGFGLILDDIGSSGADVIFDHADLELSSLQDGFEATIGADETGWWYEITGVNDTTGSSAIFSGADTWVNAGLPADFFSTYFDNEEYLSVWTQRGGGGNPSITTTIDRISVGLPAAVPEPSTFALAALGLIGLGWFSRRRKR